MRAGSRLDHWARAPEHEAVPVRSLGLDVRLLIAMAMLGVALTSASACSRKSKQDTVPKEERLLVVVQEQQASWVRNFNPLLPSGSVRWPTPAGIYEPMLIYNTVQGEYVPWLAESHSFTDDAIRLTFRLRRNVKWSDGAAFSAADVVFTFDLMKRFSALDARGVWSHLSSVRAADDFTVEFRFLHPYVPGLFRIAQQPIVPKHVWSKVDDPVSFRNPNPVATGPFTEVSTFQNQVYELRKNPHYWQPGLPKIAGLRFPAFGGNEQANLALLHGDVDWSGRFIPDVKRVFVGRDPEHHEFWFPNQGGAHSLYPNNKKPPLDDVRVRKALSHAIDRKRLIKIAVYDYTRPANPAGLSEAYKDWYRPEALPDKHWVEHDPELARSLLDAAGLKEGRDGFRTRPDGSPLEFDINVVAGWSDWVTAVQLMIQDFQRVGVRAKMKTVSYGVFYEALLNGEFDLSMGWAEEGPTPYEFYQFVMGPAGRKPLGERSLMNWGRFENKAVDDTLLTFQRTIDEAEQRALSERLQSLFSEHAPIIPLYPSPSWGLCNTSRFVGFPGPDNPYARLSPFSPPEYLLVLLNLEPR